MDKTDTPLVNSLYKIREWEHLATVDIAENLGLSLESANLDNTHEGSTLMGYVEGLLRNDSPLAEPFFKRLFITERESVAAIGRATARTKIGVLTQEWRGVPEGTLIMRLVDEYGVEHVYAEKITNDKQEGIPMSKERAELIAERDRVGATEFHNLMCRWNHTDGCSWYYEQDEDFDREGSTRQRWLNQYQTAKSAVEETVGDLTDEKFIAIATVINR